MIRKVAGGIDLAWSSETGACYAIEWSTSYASWIAAGSEVASQGSETTINLADTFTLTYQAIPNTIEVYVNHVQAIGGWSYDAGLNAVVFDPAYVPDDGELIEIMYEYFGSC